jgi:hypothetical protein
MDHGIDPFEGSAKLVDGVVEQVHQLDVADLLASRVGRSNVDGSELISLAKHWKKLRRDVTRCAREEYA